MQKKPDKKKEKNKKKKGDKANEVEDKKRPSYGISNAMGTMINSVHLNS